MSKFSRETFDITYCIILKGDLLVISNWQKHLFSETKCIVSFHSYLLIRISDGNKTIRRSRLRWKKYGKSYWVLLHPRVDPVSHWRLQWWSVAVDTCCIFILPCFMGLVNFRPFSITNRTTSSDLVVLPGLCRYWG